MGIAVCIETPTEFARFTVSESVAIPLGTILQLSGDFTASASSGADIFAGIAWEEFKGSEGLTEIVVALNGVWDLTNSNTAISLGGIVSISGANAIKQAVAAELLTGAAFGKALEAADIAEVIRVRVGLLV